MESITGLFNTIFDVHPWHVPTVHFPIALTAVGLLLLLLALWQRNEALERAAFYNMTLAALSTLVAGFTGYRDYVVRFEGDAPYINAKIFLAISLFVLTTAITVARWRQPEVLWRPATMVLYVAGFAASFILASVLGFLGGIILYGF
ncbi:MAG: hypothetical protein HC875_21815 [Anaerolineales bacterium]|nr:hypothetical protein [Anaerolineales bacterium]